MASQNSTHKLFIGIDIGGTKTAVSLGDEAGNIRKKERFATADHYNEVIDQACSSVRAMLDFASPHKVQAIGISCGGPLDPAAGIIQAPPNLPTWIDVPVVDLIARRFDLPVYLENDANACALAEWYWGNGRECRNLIFLTFGTGLGAGFILDGRLYSGASGLAGEVGHLRLAEEGPLCYGKAGSWEGFCSGSGMSRLYEMKFGRSLSAKEICDRAEAGDARALEVTDTTAEYLGRGLALLVDLFNPERVIIGSIFSRSEGLFRKRMEAVMKAEALPRTFSDCKVLPAGLGEHLGDMAALGVAIGKLRQKEGSYDR
jgi:glucokinase